MILDAYGFDEQIFNGPEHLLTGVEKFSYWFFTVNYKVWTIPYGRYQFQMVKLHPMILWRFFESTIEPLGG